jgi:adenosylhomocysteine nucleosidase
MRKFFFLFIAWLLPTTAAAADSPIGIIYAFPPEGVLLKQMLESADSTILAERIFHSGRLLDKQVLLVESEMGLTAAAMTTQLLIDKFLPEKIFFTGICGAIDSDFRIGDIAVARKWITHDYGVYDSSGFRLAKTEKGKFIYHTVDPNLFSAAELAARKGDLKFEAINQRQPQIKFANIGASGNSFVDQKEKRMWLKSNTAAEIVDMESAAVVQVANANQVAALVIRSCSDLAGGSGSATAAEELERWYRVAAENSAKFLLEILKRLE